MQYKLSQSIASLHSAPIHDTSFDFYSTRLATCSSDGTVSIYDTSNENERKILSTFKVRDSPLWSVQWAHPRFGSIIAVSSFDAEVSIWKETKPNDWQKIAYHNGHQSSVNCVQWAPLEHDLILISCSSDGTLVEFQRNHKQDEFQITRQWQAHDSAINSISWAYDEDSLLVASASSDKTIKLWEYQYDQQNYTLKATLQGHKELVRDVKWHPLNDLIVSCSEDGCVILWQVTERGDEEYKYQILQEIHLNINVWRVSWSKIVGEKLIVSGYHNTETTILVYQLNENEKLQLLSELDYQQK